MSFWFWVGLIAISVLSVPIVAVLEKMKNRQPAPLQEQQWDVEKGGQDDGEAAGEPDGEQFVANNNEEFAPAGEAAEFGDGGFGVEDGEGIANFGDDDFK